MTVNLLTEHRLEFLSLKGRMKKVGLSLYLSKCNIVGNHMSWLIYSYQVLVFARASLISSTVVMDRVFQKPGHVMAPRTVGTEQTKTIVVCSLRFFRMICVKHNISIYETLKEFLAIRRAISLNKMFVLFC